MMKRQQPAARKRSGFEWKEQCLFHQGSLVLYRCHARVFLKRGVKPGYRIESGVDRQFQYRYIRFSCIQLLHHIFDTSTVHQVVKRLSKYIKLRPSDDSCAKS